MAMYKAASAGLQAIILVEDYEDARVDNKVEVNKWRQIRGMKDED